MAHRGSAVTRERDTDVSMSHASTRYAQLWRRRAADALEEGAALRLEHAHCELGGRRKIGPVPCRNAPREGCGREEERDDKRTTKRSREERERVPCAGADRTHARDTDPVLDGGRLVLYAVCVVARNAFDASRDDGECECPADSTFVIPIRQATRHNSCNKEFECGAFSVLLTQGGSAV